jgi:hypothetical protein
MPLELNEKKSGGVGGLARVRSRRLPARPRGDEFVAQVELFVLAVREPAREKNRRQEQVAQRETRQTRNHSVKIAGLRRRDNEEVDEV